MRVSASTHVNQADVGVDHVKLHRADAIERYRMINRGVPANVVRTLARQTGIQPRRLTEILGLSWSVVSHKLREARALSTAEASLALGLARLIGQVQTIVDESGDGAGFNAAVWTGQWLERPLPALAGQRPAELMSTADGQDVLRQIVARMQSSAYS